MFSRTIAARAGSAANSAGPCLCTRRFGMPLRAKVNSPAGAAGAGGVSRIAQMSTAKANSIPPEFNQLPEDDPEDVIFNSIYGLRTIELNRPKKLNSLNASMIRKILPRLHEWSKSDMANIVVMKGAGAKAFCAGGDVTALAEYNRDDPANGWRKSSDYFGLEYKLDHYIATYGKPYVAFMDGITMGGGVGLSIHAPFRVATERTVFAMPETTIGFFPDVGASFFLPRMNGAVGTYLALTSDRLKGANVFYSGVATHYLHSTSLPQLESRLAELRFKDYDPLERRLAIVNDTLEEFTTGFPHDEPMLLAGERRAAIDRCFGHHSVPEIVAALHAETQSENHATREWADKTLDTLSKRSPTAVNVALRQMRVGRSWSIAKTFRREHQIATHFMRHPDFVEGVDALLMSKGKQREPAWQPATLDDVAAAPAEDIVEPFFRTVVDDAGKAQQPLELLNDADFSKYPFGGYGVPSEAEVKKAVVSGKKVVRKVVDDGGNEQLNDADSPKNPVGGYGEPSAAEAKETVVVYMTPKEVVGHVVARHKGRQGVAAIVQEIAKRKLGVDNNGKAVWIENEA